MLKLTTSLNEIKSFNPCASGWKDVLEGQNKTSSDSVLFPLVDTVKTNCISDVCWLLGKRKKEIQILVRFARMCSDDIKHLKNNNAYAADAADAAAYAAAYAAYAATYDAADAATYATYAAAAAYAATYDATYATYDATYDAAAAYGRQKQIERNKSFLIQCINEFKN